MSVTVDIAVEAEAWDAVPDLESLVDRAVRAAAAGAGLDANTLHEVSLMLCDDAAIAALNRTWRGKDTATNVLSFPAAGRTPPGAPRPLGDIAVAWETVQREAAAEGKAVPDHLSHLLVHGMLHLLGFDHETAEDAEAMEAQERRVLAGLGIADPYAGSEPAETAP